MNFKVEDLTPVSNAYPDMCWALFMDMVRGCPRLGMCWFYFNSSYGDVVC